MGQLQRRVGRILRHVILVMAALGAIIIAGILTSMARAEEPIPRGLGHPPGDLNHWYESNCCSKADCEPVTEGAIVETAEGYRVRYLTSRDFIAEGIVPHGSPAIRVSKDHRNHACANAQGKILCIYIVPTA